MKKTKKTLSFRLSEDTAKELEAISKRESVSQAGVISVLIHAYHGGDMDIDDIEKSFEILRLS